MPSWDIKCVECGRVITETFTNVEARDAYLDIAVSDCCDMPMVVQPSAANFKLVGKGFHCNDYPRRG